MQRSRRALLQRRAALEKSILHNNKHFCKVSASLVIIFWVLIFLLNSLTSKGNGHRDGQGTAVHEFSTHETPSCPERSMDVHHPLQSSDSTYSSDLHKNPHLIVEAANSGEEGLVIEGNNLESVIQTDQTAELVSDSGINLDKEGNNLDKSVIQIDQTAEFVSDSSINLEEALPRIDRLSRITPLGLDEFRSKAINSKEKDSSRPRENVQRVEPSGKEYNYASSNKGAKVLAHNKEAKGASNILDKDKDKYLRNPCSAEEKYVVVELSEETLVDTIEIANFEHYASNLKDFELLGSSVYPTDSWVKLGNFAAANVKHAQRFSLPEPKWVRYLKINLLSHYGTEFFCTLSVVEVYGVDAVDRMLEDLISDEKNRLEPEQKIAEQPPPHDHHNDAEDTVEEFLTDIDNQPSDESLKTTREPPKTASANHAPETKPPQVGRMPGDAVLKVLMQKVQTLDMNFSVLERYLEELNNRYGRIFKDFDDDIEKKDLLLEKITLEIKNLQKRKDIFASDIGELLVWKTVVSSQLDQLVRDNAVFRFEMKGMQEHQNDIESRSLAVIFVSFVFGCIAASKLLTDVVSSICCKQKSLRFCWMSSGWLVLLLCSSIITFILTL